MQPIALAVSQETKIIVKEAYIKRINFLIISLYAMLGNDMDVVLQGIYCDWLLLLFIITKLALSIYLNLGNH